MIRIEGDVAKLRAVGRAMREAGDKEQKRELYKAVQRATKPVKDAIKQSAVDTLPSSGGLNVWVSKIGIKTKQSYSGKFPGVTIVGTLNNKARVSGRGRGRKRARTFGARADLRAINRGRVMHPTWGHGPLVGPQMVTAGFWDKPLKGPIAFHARQEILTAMRRVMAEIAAKVERGVA